MVSIAIVVLPVARSPMINSRWPRPIGIMASIAMMPVCTGWLTLRRLMTPGRDFFQRIKCFRFDSALAIERLPQRVNDAAEQPLSDRDLKQTCPVVFASSPSDDLGGVTEQNRADFRFLEIERQSENAVREIRSSH